MLPSKRIVLRAGSVITFVMLSAAVFFSFRPTVAPDDSGQASTTLPEPADGFRQGPIRAGEVEAAEVDIRYLEEASWSQTIHHPGASFMKVHFRNLDLLPGDYVTVSDPAGLEIYTYPGSDDTTGEEPGFWALSIEGDTAVIKLHLGYSGGTPGQESLQQMGGVVDKVAWGYPPDVLESQLGPESTCGTNQRTDVICYQGTHPTEFGLSNAVARLFIVNGFFVNLCTGWRVGPNNRVFTNEHCITDQTQVSGTEVQFNYQRALCESGSPTVPTKVSGNTFLADDVTLDYALFTVNNFASIAGFGHLHLDIRTPVLSEEIYIPQHGNGNPKEFGIESDLDTGNLCRINTPVTFGLGSDTDTGYFCDTFGGSSGSPVLARSSHQVIGLHHFGTGGAACGESVFNRGVRIDQIFPQVQLYLNDDIKHAAVMTGVVFSQETGDATTSGDDPSFSCDSFSGQGGHSVWYEFTAPEDTTLNANTFGSDYDTVLAVWTGTQGSLSMQACNDDSNGTPQSKIELPVTGGNTYYLEVIGASAGESGSLHLSIANHSTYLPFIMK